MASRDRHAPPYVWLTIRVVVNVLVERATFTWGTARVADEADRIHLEEKGSGATLVVRFRVKNVRGAEGEIEVVHICRILSQQMAEVRRRTV